MSFRRLLNFTIIIILLVIALPIFAFAYLPPGAGLSAIGAFIALIGGIFIAILGFLWYPIKRLIRRMKNNDIADKEG